MKLNCKTGWWPLDKHNHLLVKLAISILLVGVAFRLLFLRSTGFSEDGDAHTPFIKQGMKPGPAVSVDFPENGVQVYTKPPVSSVDLPKGKNQIPENGTQLPESGTKVSDNSNPPVFVDSHGNRDQISENGTQVSENPTAIFPIDIPENRDQVSKQGKCDLFTGDWIPNSVGPLYTNESCSLIEGHQNCMKNGRPDTGYLYWRWNPRDCELPPFNGELFLELMRNKTWALIGDSISRNHVQSLLCMLSKLSHVMVEQAVEVYHDKEYRSKRWHFPSYNFTISVLWSPFLAKAATFEDDNGVSSADIELHLDKLDPTWTDQYQRLNYMIFSTGEWFVKTAIYYENNTMLGCHNCPQKNETELGFNFAYQKVLENVFNFIVASNHEGMIFYRTTTPDHFENGEWYNGGNCQRMAPVKEGEFKMNELTRILRSVELEEFAKAAAKASGKGIKLKLFDVMNLSLQRPDGHPGLFRHFHPFAMENTTKIYSDCLHWCLPGPIDSWNDLLMEMVVNG